MRDYRAPRWNEPLIMEMGTPGERGMFVPLAEPEVTAAVGAAAAYIPKGMARAAAPDLPEISQHQALRHYLRLSQMTLGMDLGSDISEGTCTMKYSPKLHEELVRSHRPPTCIHCRTRARCRACSRSSTSSASTSRRSPAWTRSRCSRAAARTPCTRTPASCVPTSPPGASCRSATRSSRRCSPIPAMRPRRMVAGFKIITVMPDDNGYPDLEAFKAAVGERTAGCMITNPEDTGIYNPHHRQVRRGAARRRRRWLHRPGQRQRHPRHRADARRRLRRLPLQRAQDVLQSARLRGPGDRRLSAAATSWRQYLPYRSSPRSGEKYHLDYDRPRASVACAAFSATGWASSAPTPGS